MKIVEELSKSIQISTINKLQQVSHLVNFVSVACFVKNPLSDIRVTDIRVTNFNKSHINLK